MLRDGWHMVERGFDPRTHRRIGKREIWEKPLAHRTSNSAARSTRLILPVTADLTAIPIGLSSTGDLMPLPDITWADWDDDRRLVFVRHGRLFAATVAGVRLNETELHDFNPLEPEEVAPPDWARRW